MKRSLRSSGDVARPLGLGETEQKRAKAPAKQGPYSREGGEQKELSPLQLRFVGEDLSAISPEWRVEWCAEGVPSLEKERLLCVGDAPVPHVTGEQWETLRQQVIGVVQRHRPDDSGIIIEQIAKIQDRRFVYCPQVTSFCLTHHLITHGPWVRFVERALGLAEGSVNWRDHCMGIYALYSLPGAGPLPWHTDFCALDVPAVNGDMDKLKKEHYLHKLVNVLVPMQGLSEAMGYTVTLTKHGRTPLPSNQTGHWYAIDPGYPHAADGNTCTDPAAHRVVLNISYVHPSFPMSLRKHVITHQQYWQAHVSQRAITQALTERQKQLEKQRKGQAPNKTTPRPTAAGKAGEHKENKGKKSKK